MDKNYQNFRKIAVFALSALSFCISASAIADTGRSLSGVNVVYYSDKGQLQKLSADGGFLICRDSNGRGRQYKPSVQSCVNGRIVNKGNLFCRTESGIDVEYSPAFKACVENTVINKGNLLCKNQFGFKVEYSPRFQKCVNGRVSNL